MVWQVFVIWILDSNCNLDAILGTVYITSMILSLKFKTNKPTVGALQAERWTKVTLGNVASCMDTWIAIEALYTSNNLHLGLLSWSMTVVLVGLFFLKFYCQSFGSKSSGFSWRLCCIKISVCWYLGGWKSQGKLMIKIEAY